MATLEKAPTSNFWSTSLNGAINDSVTTITLNSTVGLQAPGRLVINRQDSTGKNTPSAREVISFTGISGSDLTGVTRGADNSTARSHADGSLVESAMVVGNWDALYKVVNQEHSTSGVHSVADMITGGSVIDDDTFATASATKLATSESIKAYADNSPSSIARQAIINGNFDVWQRGTSFTDFSTAKYTADRWTSYCANTATTISRQDGTGVSGSQYCIRLQRTVGNTGTDMWTLNHGLETTDSIKFRGKKLTLSFYARAGANYSASTISSTIYSGKGTDQSPWSFTTDTSIGGVSNTITTTWTKFSVTTTNVVASDVTQLRIAFARGSSGTAGAADYCEIAQVQLCAGDVALPFMPKSFEAELDACQRYYQKSYNYETTPGSSGASGFILNQVGRDTGPRMRVTHQLHKIMRVAPTISYWDRVGNSSKITTYSGDTITDNQDINNISSSGESKIVVTNANASGYAFHFEADAEL